MALQLKNLDAPVDDQSSVFIIYMVPHNYIDTQFQRIWSFFWPP